MSDPAEFKVNTARDALSLLSQKMFKKFGKDALADIEDVWFQLGLAVGQKMKKNLPDTRLTTAASVFVEGGRKRGINVDILRLDDNGFCVTGDHCGVGLAGKGYELCWACMGVDRGIFEAISGKKVKMKIKKSIAENDKKCEILIEL